MKEALLTSALLQLPMSMGRGVKEARVNDVLEEMVHPCSLTDMRRHLCLSTPYF